LIPANGIKCEPTGPRTLPVLTNVSGQNNRFGEMQHIKVADAGVYHMFIRYGSPDARPVKLIINGKDSGETLATPTGGTTEANQVWQRPIAVELIEGDNNIRLVPGDTNVSKLFPGITMFNIVTP
jgi:hypothetical protein